ncbi:hypothetical protein [Amycolatopsis sp. lyj-90]|uniref:hypothetical protein n=1 Tax=Amycolatopsis sp. lyj-90 TaxID=2789285 RepID=UPI00397B0DB3
MINRIGQAQQIASDRSDTHRAVPLACESHFPTTFNAAKVAFATRHLGYDKHDPASRGTGNSRNGTRSKTVRGSRSRFMHQTCCDARFGG